MDKEHRCELEAFPLATFGEQLTPEQLAMLTRILTASSRPTVLDEVPQFSENVVDQLRQMRR